jgi:hypothetical protein
MSKHIKVNASKGNDNKTEIGGFAVHPFANDYPLLSVIDPEWFEQTVKDIEANGLTDRIEIIINKDGAKVIIDGRNRALALDRLGIKIDPDKHMTVKRFSCEEGLRKHITSKNLHRRHLTLEDRRKIAAALLKAKSEASNLQISKQVKLSDKTIDTVRCRLEERSEIPNVETRTDTKGRPQRATKARAPTEAAAKAKERRRLARAKQNQEWEAQRKAEWQKYLEEEAAKEAAEERAITILIEHLNPEALEEFLACLRICDNMRIQTMERVAQQKISSVVAANNDDGLDIPASLLREPEAVA